MEYIIGHFLSSQGVKLIQEFSLTMVKISTVSICAWSVVGLVIIGAICDHMWNQNIFLRAINVLIVKSASSSKVLEVNMKEDCANYDNCCK